MTPEQQAQLQWELSQMPTTGPVRPWRIAGVPPQHPEDVIEAVMGTFALNRADAIAKIDDDITRLKTFKEHFSA